MVFNENISSVTVKDPKVSPDNLQPKKKYLIKAAINGNGMESKATLWFRKEIHVPMEPGLFLYILKKIV